MARAALCPPMCQPVWRKFVHQTNARAHFAFMAHVRTCETPFFFCFAVRKIEMPGCAPPAGGHRRRDRSRSLIAVQLFNYIQFGAPGWPGWIFFVCSRHRRLFSFDWCVCVCMPMPGGGELNGNCRTTNIQQKNRHGKLFVPARLIIHFMHF